MVSIVNTAAVLITLLVATALPAAGEGPLLTLAQAVELALLHNRELGAAEARTELSREVLAEARARRLPRVTLTETVSRTTNPSLVFSNLLGQQAFTEENFEVQTLNDPSALDNFRTAVVLDQPLWAGGRLHHGVEAARLAGESAALRHERTRQEVVGRVIDAYTGAVLAARQHEVAGDGLETARANTAVVADLRAAGLVVESDLLQAQLRESELEEAVVRAVRDVEVGRAALNMVLGRDLATPFSLPREIEPHGDAPGALDDLLAEARERRPDLRAAASDVESIGHLVQQARADRRPEIGVSGAYEANAEEGPGTDGTNWSVFVGGRFTVFDGQAGRARVRQAGERQREAREVRESLALAADLEVRRAFHDLHAAGRRVEHTARAIALADSSLRVVRDRYKEGLATWIELREGETLLTGARTRNLAARRDLVLADVALDLALGRL